MKVLKVIVKLVLAIGAMMLVGGSGGSSDLFGTITVFALFYGLITYYIAIFSHTDTFLVGENLISMLFAIVLNLGLPILVILIPMFILQSLLGEIGVIILGIVILILCVGCVLSDFVQAARVFKPDFLGSFGDIFDISLDSDD